MKHLANKKGRLILSAIVIIFIAIQFIRPPLDNPPVITDITAPVAVKNILRTSCYDCHSNETRTLWFDRITPANFLVASDVERARAALNFSEWNRYSPDRQKQIMYEVLNQIEFGVMPLQRYTSLHRGTHIQPSQIDSLRAYLNSMLITQVVNTGKIKTWQDQYNSWIRGKKEPRDARPDLNGIAFLPGYKDWVAISSTERQDNGTMRIIAGNTIAVQAIKTNHTHPWPDGAALTKIQWSQVMDSSGIIRAGEFRQVDFMIKDKNKYAATDGWGYARWTKGTQLVPYGDNVRFVTGCANCHQAMKKNDYIFTLPVAITTDKGMEGKVIYSTVNKQQGIMSTLYGNDIAVNFARTHDAVEYPAGSVLTMVTWKQKEDPHWFGAVIPDRVQSIEKVTFTEANYKTMLPTYELKQGNPLPEAKTSQTDAIKERIQVIINRTASVMP